jgi:hypothetical protein
MSWNYWWPNGYDCMDYAQEQCIGIADYQRCVDIENANCPYQYY